MTRAKHLAVILFALIASTGLLAGRAVAQQEQPQGTFERPFVAGGQVNMDLSAGDYTIRAGQDNRILVQWNAESPADAPKVKVDIQRKGNTATLVTRGPKNNMRYVVEVPAHSGLHLDLSAGNLRINGITGNKDIGSWAGNIDIEIGPTNQYATIDTAVKAGEIRANALNVNTGGVFRSFRWKGPGRLTLRVRLTAGNLRLL